MRSLLLAPIIALLCAAGPLPDAAPAGEMAQDSAAVAALRDREQRLTVPVFIAGQGPYRFLVDTGAQATVLARELAEALAMAPSGRATLVGMADSIPVQTVVLDRLGFAGRELNGMTAPLLARGDIGADGIIGLDSLQHLRVTLDLKGDTLDVAPSPSLGAARGYEIVVRARARKGQMIIARADFDGVRTAVVIDTGSQLSIGNRALQAALRARTRAKMTSTDVTGALLESDLAHARRLQIDDLTMTDIPIAFADSPVFAALGLGNEPAVVLGMGNLRLFDRVAIDFATRKVLFDLPKGALAR